MSAVSGGITLRLVRLQSELKQARDWAALNVAIVRGCMVALAAIGCLALIGAIGACVAVQIILRSDQDDCEAGSLSPPGEFIYPGARVLGSENCSAFLVAWADYRLVAAADVAAVTAFYRAALQRWLDNYGEGAVEEGPGILRASASSDGGATYHGRRVTISESRPRDWDLHDEDLPDPATYIEIREWFGVS